MSSVDVTYNGESHLRISQVDISWCLICSDEKDRRQGWFSLSRGCSSLPLIHRPALLVRMSIVVLKNTTQAVISFKTKAKQKNNSIFFFFENSSNSSGNILSITISCFPGIEIWCHMYMSPSRTLFASAVVYDGWGTVKQWQRKSSRVHRKIWRWITDALGLFFLCRVVHKLLWRSTASWTLLWSRTLKLSIWVPEHASRSRHDPCITIAVSIFTFET